MTQHDLKQIKNALKRLEAEERKTKDILESCRIYDIPCSMVEERLLKLQQRYYMLKAVETFLSGKPELFNILTGE